MVSYLVGRTPIMFFSPSQPIVAFEVGYVGGNNDNSLYVLATGSFEGEYSHSESASCCNARFFIRNNVIPHLIPVLSKHGLCLMYR